LRHLKIIWDFEGNWGWGSGGSRWSRRDLENCAYLWKNPGYAPVRACAVLISRVEFWLALCPKLLFVRLFVIWQSFML